MLQASVHRPHIPTRLGRSTLDSPSCWLRRRWLFSSLASSKSRNMFLRSGTSYRFRNGTEVFLDVWPSNDCSTSREGGYNLFVEKLRTKQGNMILSHRHLELAAIPNQGREAVTVCSHSTLRGFVCCRQSGLKLGAQGWGLYAQHAPYNQSISGREHVNVS